MHQLALSMAERGLKAKAMIQCQCQFFWQRIGDFEGLVFVSGNTTSTCSDAFMLLFLLNSMDSDASDRGEKSAVVKSLS
jgi:hypothetical protein